MKDLCYQILGIYALIIMSNSNISGRMSLSMGGDDITEFLYVLLRRIKFPYKDMDLNHSYDWNVMEDLKSRLCTLGDVRVTILSVIFVSMLY